MLDAHTAVEEAVVRLRVTESLAKHLRQESYPEEAPEVASWKVTPAPHCVRKYVCPKDQLEAL